MKKLRIRTQTWTYEQLIPDTMLIKYKKLIASRAKQIYQDPTKATKTKKQALDILLTADKEIWEKFK